MKLQSGYTLSTVSKDMDRDSGERGETGWQLSGSKKRKLEDYDDYSINFFYTDQQSAAIQAVTWEA